MAEDTLDDKLLKDYSFRVRKVRVHMSKYGRRYVMDFNDWWDFADYVKQQQLDCHVTCVIGWEYVDAQSSQ